MSLPPRLALDAGPLIALYHAADPDHTEAVRGFSRLAENKSWLLVPLPVVLEVYKWLLFEGGPDKARLALGKMREALEIVPLSLADLEALQTLTDALPGWKGTLEDANVALLGLRLGIPVWTLNYRDLGVFGRLEFWTG